MFAGVNSYHSAVEEREGLLSDCLILILHVDVLKYHLCCEWSALEVNSFQPDPWREVVLVIGDVDVVSPGVLLSFLFIDSYYLREPSFNNLLFWIS